MVVVNGVAESNDAVALTAAHRPERALVDLHAIVNVAMVTVLVMKLVSILLWRRL